MTTTNADTPSASSRRPVWLPLAAVYLMLAGMFGLASLALLVRNLRYANEIPWMPVLFALLVQVGRLVAGMRLLQGRSSAVLACGVVASGQVLSVVTVPLISGRMDIQSTLSIAALVETLLVMVIWRLSYRWRALGWLRTHGVSSKAVSSQALARSPAEVMWMSMIGVQVLASMLYVPTLLQLTRTGEIAALYALLFLMAALLSLLGAVLLYLQHAGARYPLLAAAVGWVASLAAVQLLAAVGVAIAACGFVVCVHQASATPSASPQAGGS